MDIHRIGIVGCDKIDSQTLQHMIVRHGYLADAMDASADVVAYCAAVRPLALVINIARDRQPVLAAISSLRKSAEAPLIIVSGPPSDPACQIDCLAVGADDYLAQPVQIIELVARLSILLGRDWPAHAIDSVVQVLTATEHEVFTVLREAMPETLSREEIMWEIRKHRISPEDRTLDVHISHIRKKLALIHARFEIRTVRGKGFYLVEGGGEQQTSSTRVGQYQNRRRA